MTEIRAFIATPCLGFSLCLNYHESIVNLLMAARDRPDINLSFAHLGHVSLVHLARNMCVKFFLESDYTHLFFIDADIGFEPESVFKALDSGLDVVAGLCPFKDDSGETVVDRPKATNRYTPVIKAGTGFMCIRRNVFEKMLKDIPDLTYMADRDGTLSYRFFDTGRDLGEDYAFCARWGSLGGKIHADTISKFTHQGVKVYQERT